MNPRYRSVEAFQPSLPKDSFKLLSKDYDSERYVGERRSVESILIPVETTQGLGVRVRAGPFDFSSVFFARSPSAASSIATRPCVL